MQLTHHQDSIVQIVLISESRRLQASLSTYGVITQTPEEISPVQIWSQWDMVKVYEKLGQSEREYKFTYLTRNQDLRSWF